MTSTPLWTFSHVTLRGPARPRLDSVSLEIQSGITAVAGDSGAGKSSLLNLLVGFERPDEGRIDCHGVPRSGQLPVYWLPPGDGLWSHLSVRQHLETVRPAGQNSKGLIDQWLIRLDLVALAGAFPDDLSQGERSRLAMARAIVSQALVLVLDEPLVHTSLLKQPDYWQAVREHCTQTATSIVFASHDCQVIAQQADRILILDAGLLVYSGPLQAPSEPLRSTAGAELLKRILYHRQEQSNLGPMVKQKPADG